VTSLIVTVGQRFENFFTLQSINTLEKFVDKWNSIHYFRNRAEVINRCLSSFISIVYQALSRAFHSVTQVDTNVVLSFLTFNKQQRQNDTYVKQMVSTSLYF